MRALVSVSRSAADNDLSTATATSTSWDSIRDRRLKPESISVSQLLLGPLEETLLEGADDLDRNPQQLIRSPPLVHCAAQKPSRPTKSPAAIFVTCDACAADVAANATPPKIPNVPAAASPVPITGALATLYRITFDYAANRSGAALRNAAIDATTESASCSFQSEARSHVV